MPDILRWSKSQWKVFKTIKHPKWSPSHNLKRTEILNSINLPNSERYASPYRRRVVRKQENIDDIDDNSLRYLQNGVEHSLIDQDNSTVLISLQKLSVRHPIFSKINPNALKYIL